MWLVVVLLFLIFMSIYILCPLCKRSHVYDVGSPYRPFCSERCQLIDLGAWSQEGYRIPLSGSERIEDSSE